MSEEDLQSSDVLEVVVPSSKLAHIAALSSSDGWDRFNGGPSINQLVSLAEGSDALASGFRVVLSKDCDGGYSMEVRGFLVGVDITTPGEVQAALSLFAEKCGKASSSV